jgi:hypothetical protein
MSRHYAMPALLEAGYATFDHQSRWLNNDIACIHEILLADIAAGAESEGDDSVILPQTFARADEPPVAPADGCRLHWCVSDSCTFPLDVSPSAFVGRRRTAHSDMRPN